MQLLVDVREFSENKEIPSTCSTPLFCFYTPWQRQNTRCFMMFSGGIEMEQWGIMG